jgi:hypothetical protein
MQNLTGWQADLPLASVRDPAALAKLPPDEQKAWQKLWTEVAALTKVADAHFKEVFHCKGAVTPVHPAPFHEMKLEAGTVYVIDLESKKFDAYLKLQDAQGNTLAEDDNSGGNGNSRLVFTPAKTGTYRLLATSLVAQSIGYYILTVRAFSTPNR